MKYKLFCICIGLLLATAPAHARRVALVIGNAAYQSEKPLANPVSDARLIARTLKDDLQFDDVEKLENAGIEQIDRAVDRFVERAQRADAAVFYFSGHGMQDDGKRNYLIPVDAKLQSGNDLKRKAFSADDLVQRLGNANPRISLVVLDACRDNPFASGTKSASKGLARISDSNFNEGMLIAYATRDGDVAKDDSPYARTLADNLKRRDQPILVAFDNVAASVRQATDGKQRPTRYGDLPATTYLLPFMSGGKPVQSPAQQQLIEDQAWAAAKHANTVDALENYLERYPNGIYAQEAQMILKGLRNPAGTTSNPPASAATAGTTVKVGEVFRDCNDTACPEMVWIPKGSFMMGSESGNIDEKPVHRVNISYDLAVGKYPVTFAQWDACFAAGGCSHKLLGRIPVEKPDEGLGRGNRPVTPVSWDDAQQYARWLSRKTGRKYRLLGEAEWEYAARAGTTTRYYWGDQASHEYANYGKDECCGGKIEGRDQWEGASPVGSFAPNAWGLYDMAGNVWNWVEDCWNDNYTGAPNNGSAWNSGDCSHRVLRGGSWAVEPSRVRSAVRNWFEAANWKIISGFRVARTKD